MFTEIILESMQRDAAEKVQDAIRTIKYTRTISIAHHLFSLLAGLVAYLTLLFGFLFADRYPKCGMGIIGAAIGLSLVVLIASTILKRDPSFLSMMNKTLSKAASKINKSRQDDPFFAQLCSLLILLYLPLGAIVIAGLLSQSLWIVASSEPPQVFIDPVRQVITYTTVIIPIQVALFTFMFAQLLGKYSSRIVGALYRHPAILLLWLYPFVSLILLNIASIYGYPASLKNVIPFFFACLDVICLIITIWVANAGTQADKVMVYAGGWFSKRVRRGVKRPVVEDVPRKWLWTLLHYLGLDWRDPDRMTLFSPPQKAIAVTNPLISSLFNVANKSVVEGQQEVFFAALIGIKKVIAAYVKKRASYFGTADPIISYTTDQLASLLSASSKSSNEYLITEVVRCIGDGAILSLEIDVLPRKKYPSVDERMTRGNNHPLTSSWIQLLGEAFELSHTLMRSTAASETINQLNRIAVVAFLREYGGIVFVGYLPKLKEIHSTCICKPDAYHLTLAGECIAKTMKLWSVVTSKHGQWSSRENLNEALADTLFQMAITQFVVEKLPSFNFHDPTSVLCSKLERDQIIIQDIFFITVFRSFSKWWEQREIVDDLMRIINLVVQLAAEAVKNKIAGVDSYSEAFYEISYVVLRGLPEHYQKALTRNGEDIEFRGPTLAPREILEDGIFGQWSQLFPVFFTADHHLGLDWKQNFFGILGIGMVRYCDQKRDTLKSALTKLIQEYFALCLEENIKQEHGIAEWAWDYLQLTGAWTLHFLKEEGLARMIAKEVAEGRPFHYSPMGIFHSSSGRYGTYGYPEASLHSDFFLPWLRNLQPQEYLSKQEWDTFRLWQKQLMNDEVLMPYYEIVEETREPLRKDFYKRMRERKEKK
jgi:hypothetical protein